MFVVAPLLPDRAARLDRPRRAPPACARCGRRLVAARPAGADPVRALPPAQGALGHADDRPALDVQDSRDASAARRRRARRGARAPGRSSCSCRAAYALVLPRSPCSPTSRSRSSRSSRPARHGARRRGALFEGIRVPDRDWIDRAVPDGARASLRSGPGSTHRFTSTRTSSSTAASARSTTRAGRSPGGFPETAVAVDAEHRRACAAATGRLQARVRPHGRLGRARRRAGRPRRAARADAVPRRHGPLISTTTRHAALPERHVVGTGGHLPARALRRAGR